MANAGLRFEDKVEGASNFSPWREHIALVLEEQGLWEFVEGTIAALADPVQLAAHERKDVKARRIIIDGVKDCIIPHLSGKKTTKDMWEALTKLSQSNNQSRKMLLGEKLESTKMARGDFVATYLTKFTQIRDELAQPCYDISAAKHVMRYLRGTVEYELSYIQRDGVKLTGFTDVDWAGSTVDKKSTSGCCFSLGSGVVS
jgi:hypothetical protein